MTIGEFEIFIENAFISIGGYIGRLLLTLFGEIPKDDVQILDIIVLFFIGCWLLSLVISGLSAIKDYSISIICAIWKFKNKIFKTRTYRDLLASFIIFILNGLAFVIVYWGGFIIGAGLSTIALVMMLDETGNTITWSLIMIFSLLYGILIYFKHKAIYNVLGKELPLKLLFFIFGKGKHE